MDTREQEFSFEAGALVRRFVREMLDDEVFVGRKIRWKENRRWLDSRFFVRGDENDIAATASRIRAYIGAVDET
jgi:hypothetical protein